MSAKIFIGQHGEYQLIGPVAYMGKEGCRSVVCTTTGDGRCRGWHCCYCDQPCSSQGHRCDVAVAILDEAKRALDEETP
jgi:hypothetical protein